MRKMKKIVLGIIFIFLFSVVAWNIISLNRIEFWKISVGNFLTILVAILISYYFAKKNQDEKSKKEIFIGLLRNMTDLVSDESMTHISAETDINYILTKKRRLNNYMIIFKQYAKDFGVEEQCIFIEERINQYIDFLGNHTDDKEYLSKSRKELESPLGIAETKLFETMLRLYD